jgi:5-methylcytosine-specific restriction endonuclease McrA
LNPKTGQRLKADLDALDTYKAKRFVAKTWHNPYTEKEKAREEKERIKRESLFSYNQLWHGEEDRQGAWDLREEMILLKGTICAIRGADCISQGKPLHPSEVETDHIIPRKRFKDPKEADSMDNLQPTCTPCHRAKTKIGSESAEPDAVKVARPVLNGGDGETADTALCPYPTGCSQERRGG